MPQFAKKHPLLVSVVFTAVVFLVIDAASVVFYPLAWHYTSIPEDILYYLADIVPYLAGLVAIFYFLWLFRLLPRVGFAPQGLGRGLGLGWALIALSLYSFISYLLYLDPETFTLPSTSLFLICLLDVLMIGIVEELIFRGGVLNLLLLKWGHSRGGIYLCAIVSSVFFGAIHFTNWLYYPQMFWSTMGQMIYASFFGVLMAALYLRSHNIWAVSLHHALFNSTLILSIFSQEAAVLEFTDTTAAGALYSVITAIPYLLLGLFLLRKVTPMKKESSKREGIYEDYDTYEDYD